MIRYERDPKLIRQHADEGINELLPEGIYPEGNRRILADMVFVSGDENLPGEVNFSDLAIDAGIDALKRSANILCDSPMVAEGINTERLRKEPMCLVQRPNVISQAKSLRLTRSMVAVDNWRRFAEGSIVVIGNEPTALLRFIELTEQRKMPRPALVIAMPSGYAGAEQARQYLWEHHQKMQIPCIITMGKKGGSLLAVTALNSIIRLWRVEIEQNSDH